MSQQVLDGLTKFFRPQQVVDIALLSAYYMAAGALIVGLDVEIEGPESIAKELAWQKRQMQAPR